MAGFLKASKCHFWIGDKVKSLHQKVAMYQGLAVARCFSTVKTSQNAGKKEPKTFDKVDCLKLVCSISNLKLWISFLDFKKILLRVKMSVVYYRQKVVKHGYFQCIGIQQELVELFLLFSQVSSIDRLSIPIHRGARKIVNFPRWFQTLTILIPSSPVSGSTGNKSALKATGTGWFVLNLKNVP